MSTETHPPWCFNHWHPTELDDSSIHMSAPIAWGREGSYVKVEDDGNGPRIYVSARLDRSDWECADLDISPDAARFLASALLDAANTAQGGLDR
jgi:hypothetical protein